ncbi:AAA family ATPase [Sphingomonas sp. CLY1604]|uniref:AAA family ATPase n=1 Tax=Sphingomonas sp. CLY1604 TaxID=3457786 RepID=UPI003FD747DF
MTETTDGRPDSLHYLWLELENVRAFAKRQKLDLRDDEGRPNRWCLILGENGVGKTTLLQALAVLRPVPRVADGRRSGGADAGVPTMSQPELAGRENHEVERFARRSASRAAMSATLADPDGKRVTMSVGITMAEDAMADFHIPGVRHRLRSAGPLVLSYGASRHIGHGNKSSVAERDMSSALFEDFVDLYDAEELLEELDHAARVGPKKVMARDERRLEAIYQAVASLLEGLKRTDIEFRGPRVPGRKPSECGVHVRTPSGVVPLADLSLGYQAMFAWTVDLAYRLLQAYPQSDAPMLEAAIVLVDEIDLHLHPRWQRDLRRHMLTHFPNVQFIATTHSPITAQDAIAEGGVVAVVRWNDKGAQILTNPLPRRHWTMDQLVTSELLGFGAPRPKGAERKMERRVEILRKERPTRKELAELEELDSFVASLPVGRITGEASFEHLMADYRRDFPEDDA